IKVVDGSMIGTIVGQPSPSAILLDFMLDLSFPLGLPTPMPLLSGLQLPPPPPPIMAALLDSAFASTIQASQTALSPDVQPVDSSKIYTDSTNGNERTLRENVSDTMFQLLTGNDGLDGFLYIGRPNSRTGRPKQ